MPVSYELWDVESGNLIADYATEAEALDEVRRVLDYDQAGDAIDHLALLRRDTSGEVLLAEGESLVNRTGFRRVKGAQ